MGFQAPRTHMFSIVGPEGSTLEGFWAILSLVQGRSILSCSARKQYNTGVW